MSHLPGGCRHGTHTTHRPDLAPVKLVAAGRGLGMDGREICTDGCTGPRMFAKTLELRMAPIASCLTPQYGACEQRLAPQGYEALRVEIARMEGPQAHALGQGNRGAEACCVEMVLEFPHEHREAELARAVRRRDTLEPKLVMKY